VSCKKKISLKHKPSKIHRCTPVGTPRKQNPRQEIYSAHMQAKEPSHVYIHMYICIYTHTYTYILGLRFTNRIYLGESTNRSFKAKGQITKTIAMEVQMRSPAVVAEAVLQHKLMLVGEGT
jgi:hypothetical protein